MNTFLAMLEVHQSGLPFLHLEIYLLPLKSLFPSSLYDAHALKAVASSSLFLHEDVNWRSPHIGDMRNHTPTKNSPVVCIK